MNYLYAKIQRLKVQEAWNEHGCTIIWTDRQTLTEACSGALPYHTLLRKKVNNKYTYRKVQRQNLQH